MARLSSTPSRPDATTPPRARDAHLGFTGRLARMGALHPWRTLGAWVVLIALAVVAAGSISDVLVQENSAGIDIEAQTAQDLVARAQATLGQEPRPHRVRHGREPERRHGPPTPDLPAAGRRPHRDPADRRRGDRTSSPRPTASPALVSEDGTVALIQAQMVSRRTRGRPAPRRRRAAPPTGPPTAYRDRDGRQRQHQHRVLATSPRRPSVGRELLGIPIALVVLILVFGAVVAALLPLGLGIVSILVAMGLTASSASSRTSTCSSST